MHIVWMSEPPDVHSGYGQQTLEVCKHFLKQNHIVSCIAMTPRPKSKFYIYEGIEVYSVPGSGELHQVRKIIHDLKPDIFIALADVRFFEYLFMLEKDIRKFGPFLFWHLWDNDPFPFNNVPFYASVSKVVCASLFTYNLLKQNGIDNIEYIPHCVDTRVYKPMRKKEMQVFPDLLRQNCMSEAKRVKLWFGTVEANIDRKRLPDLIRIFGKFMKRHKDVGLVLHTNPTDLRGPNLFKAKTHFLGDSKEELIIVSNATNQKRSYLRELYNYIDVFVNISYNEGFGLGEIEAMACGTPCLVTDTAAQKHKLAEGKLGWLLPPDIRHMLSGHGLTLIYQDLVSDEAVLNKLEYIYNHQDEIRQKSVSCRDFVQQEFEASMVGGKFLKLADKLINSDIIDRPDFFIRKA